MWGNNKERFKQDSTTFSNPLIFCLQRFYRIYLFDFTLLYLPTVICIYDVNYVISGDMEKWDPMKFDYDSKSFNRYVDGPGELIQTREEKDAITLFVDYIPSAISKVGYGCSYCK